MRKIYLPLFLTAGLTGCGGGAGNPPPAAPTSAKSQSAVHVSSPANNSTVAPSVQYVATATTTCAAGINKMSVYTNPTTLAYQVNGGNLHTSLNLTPGAYATKV
jgi:hypothetical protein